MSNLPRFGRGRYDEGIPARPASVPPNRRIPPMSDSLFEQLPADLSRGGADAVLAKVRYQLQVLEKKMGGSAAPQRQRRLFQSQES